MSTTSVSYADEFDADSAMQWGWLWADIDGRSRWHLVHTFEDDAESEIMLRFIDPHEASDFTDAAEGYDKAPFVALMPPGHVASLSGQKNADRRVSLWWGDGSSTHYEWRAGTPEGDKIAANATRSVARIVQSEDEA